jgi:peptide methionine sulfoxide reductase MsrA
MERGVRLSTLPSLCRRFWGVEEEFRKIKDVRSTMVGYTGEWLEYPTYEHV